VQANRAAYLIVTGLLGHAIAHEQFPISTEPYGQDPNAPVAHEDRAEFRF